MFSCAPVIDSVGSARARVCVWHSQVNPALEEQHYLGTWEMFLPSEMLLSYVWAFVASFRSCAQTPVCIRFASMYEYDYRLFQKRLLGEPGAAWPQ